MISILVCGTRLVNLGNCIIIYEDLKERRRKTKKTKETTHYYY